MPKTKGLTSIEVAILVAIVIVIAVAAGWYMYTTFVASTQSQTKLAISNAIYFRHNGTLVLYVTNVGQTEVAVQYVMLSRWQCTLSPSPVGIGITGMAVIRAQCPPYIAFEGTMVQGVLITRTGMSFPFTATVSIT